MLGQPAEDPCGCTSYTEKGVSGEKRNISVLKPIPDCTYFKGKIVIDEPTYFNNLSIRMETGAEIEVTSTLNVYESNIGTCDDMWKGILVVGDNNANSGLIIFSESKISGAEIAIKLTDNSKYFIQQSEFDNNYIGIATGSPFAADPDPMTVYPSDGIILGCQFHTSTSLPDPYNGQYYYPSWPSNVAIPYDQGYAALYIAGSTGLYMGELGATGSDRNHIYNMRNGVIVRSADTKILGTDFAHFEGTVSKIFAANDLLNYNQRGISLENSVCHIEQDTFVDLMIGVQSLLTSQDIVDNYFLLSTQSPIRSTRGIKLDLPIRAFVSENVLYDGYMGIDVFGSSNGGLDIRYNDLFRSITAANNVGINLQRVYGVGYDNSVKENEIEITGGNQAVGISLNAVSELNLYHNTVDFLETMSLTAGEENAGISGLNVINSLIAENYITGNSNYRTNDNNAGIIWTNGLSNKFHCNNTDDMYFGFHIIGLNMETMLKSNELYDATDGLELFSPVHLGTQTHYGNQWLGSYAAFGAFINGPDPEGTASASTFIADASAASPGVLIPDVIGPTSVDDDWFQDDDGTSAAVMCNAYPPPAPLVDSLVKLVRYDLEYTDYEDEMNWMRKADILTFLHMYPAYLSNTVLDSFFDAEETTALGELIWAEWQMSKAHGINGAMPVKDSTAFDYLGQVRRLDSLIATNPINIVALMALRVLKIDTLSGHFDDWRGMLDSQISDTGDALGDAVDVADNVTPTNDQESALQIMLGLQGWHYKGDSLTTGELADVYDYARQCPWLGARSMSEAQMLFASLADSTYTHRPGACITYEPFNIMDRSKSYSDAFQLFPNPASDAVTVYLPAWAELLSMHGTDGKQWVQRNVTGQTYVQVPTKVLPSGLYTIRINGGNQSEAKQLSITQ